METVTGRCQKNFKDAQLRNAKMHHLDEKHVVFGQVVDGEDVISYVSWQLDKHLLHWKPLPDKWPEIKL